MLGSLNDWQRLCGIGIPGFLEGLKSSGKIRNIGFSFHGGSGEFLKVIDAYGWDFCMMQYNYIDEHTQGGRKGIERCIEKKVAVIVMEPLRGGMLADRLPDGAVKIFNDFPVKRKPAEWALRWLWNQPGVSTVLSGMKTMQNLRDNIQAADDSGAGMLSEDENRVFERVTDVFRSQQYVGCTSCGYCLPCPRGVEIAQCFDLYNQRAQANFKSRLISKGHAWFYYILRTMGGNAGLCNGCRACEPKCPQGLEIAVELGRVRRRMEGPLYRPVRYLVKKILKR
jgi:hypothetical protein